jgi:crotonobetainyl-CoA:carnitine CoA-transferase CaiB-like acyl-CoA transferase
MSNEQGNMGVLAGVRVIDLTRVLGGPYCTQTLGDHGADIIKVEPPTGDETREWGPPFEKDDAGRILSSAYFKGVNRNKRCVALDLRTKEGRAVLFRFLEHADVLIENFKTGTLEKWGLGYEDVLKPRYPRLIHCRITGFGADGPLGAYPGYDAAVQAATGLFSINGTPDSGPLRLGSPVVDMVTGLHAAIAISMALYEREHSGQGQFVETTLYDTGISLLHPHAANWFMSGRLPQLSGNAHPNISPYDLYVSKTRPVFLAVGNDGQFRRLIEILGCPELAADVRFKSNGARVENRDALTRVLAARIAEWDGEELCTRLLDAGVPAGPANNVAEVLTDAHTRHRQMVVEKDGYRGTGLPIKFARTPGSVRRAPRHFADDNREVLVEEGYTDSEIEALAKAGAVVVERRS